MLHRDENHFGVYTTYSFNQKYVSLLMSNQYGLSESSCTDGTIIMKALKPQLRDLLFISYLLPLLCNSSIPYALAPKCGVKYL